MKRMLVIAVTVVLAATGPAARAQTITELDRDPDRYDERTVVVTGELVGDFGRRGDLVWTQVNDDGYVNAPLRGGGSLVGANTSLAVAVDHELFERELGSEAPGGYRRRGPVVEVTAIFHYHDDARSGETWLEATHLTLVRPSLPLQEPNRVPLAVAGMVLGALGYVLHLRGRRTD